MKIRYQWMNKNESRLPPQTSLKGFRSIWQIYRGQKWNELLSSFDNLYYFYFYEPNTNEKKKDFFLNTS